MRPPPISGSSGEMRAMAAKRLKNSSSAPKTIDGRMMTAAHKGEARFDPARVLFDASGYENYFAVPGDGRRFLMMALLPGAESSEIRLVSNFVEELRRKFR